MNHIQDIIRRLQLGESERRIAQDMQVSRGTIRKYHQIAKEKGYLENPGIRPSDSELKEALGPGVQVPRQPSTVEPYRETIKGWVEQDIEMTAIWLRLQENYGYKGSYSSIRRFVHQLEPVEPEAYIRVHSEPGEDMQVDFGSVGQLYDPVSKRLRTAYVFVATLCYSRHQYAELVFDQKVGTWISLHKRTFEYFGVPHRIAYDNLKTAVFKVLEGHNRQEQEAFKAFRSFYLFDSHYCTPSQGHEKGGVENDVGYVQRNFFAPFLRIDNFEELNQILLECCQNDLDRHVRGQKEPVAELVEVDKARLIPLPKQDYLACVTRPVKANPYCQVVYETNRYSVPHSYAGKQLVLRAYPFKIEVISLEGVIASHLRCFGWEQDILDPMHYISLLEQRPGAFEHAQPIRQWRKKWPASYEQLLRSLQENKPEGQGVREFISILKLHQSYSSDMLEKAVSAAVLNGRMGLDGVMYHLQRSSSPVPESQPINLSNLPLLANVGCQPVDLHIYDQLMGVH